MVLRRADLVVARFDDLQEAFRHGQVFHAVGAGFGNLVVGHGGADEAQFLTEDFRDLVVVETGTGGFVAQAVAVFIHGHGVAGHHAGSLLRLAFQFQRRAEGQQLGVEIVARQHVERAVGIVGFTSAFRGAVAGEVLDVGVDALRAPAQVVAFLVIGALQGVHIRRGHIHAQLRILAEGALDAAPAGLGGQVDLRAVDAGHAHRAVFLRVGVGHLSHDGGIEGRAQGQGARPAGDQRAGFRLALHGDAVLGGFRVGLHPVDVAHRVAGVGKGHGRREGAYALVHHALGGVAQVAGAGGGVHGQHHQAGHLLIVRLHLLRQVGGAGFGVQAPVFVRVQRAVLVQVLEGVSAVFQDFHAAVSAVTQGGAAFVFHLDPPVLGGRLGVLRALGKRRDREDGQDQCQGNCQAQDFPCHWNTSLICVDEYYGTLLMILYHSPLPPGGICHRLPVFWHILSYSPKNLSAKKQSCRGCTA